MKSLMGSGDILFFPWWQYQLSEMGGERKTKNSSFLAGFLSALSWHGSIFFSAIIFELICSWPGSLLFYSPSLTPKWISSFLLWGTFSQSIFKCSVSSSISSGVMGLTQPLLQLSSCFSRGPCTHSVWGQKRGLPECSFCWRSNVTTHFLLATWSSVQPPASLTSYT